MKAYISLVLHSEVAHFSAGKLHSSSCQELSNYLSKQKRNALQIMVEVFFVPFIYPHFPASIKSGKISYSSNDLTSVEVYVRSYIYSRESVDKDIIVFSYSTQLPAPVQDIIVFCYEQTIKYILLYLK